MRILGSELSREAFNLLNSEITTVVIATVDEDGYPRTAPFHWIVAKDKKTLKVAVNPRHVTYENIKRDGRVMVCVLDQGNIAIGIKGRAQIIKEDMKSIPWLITMVEIKIDEVKSDALAWVPIKHGVRFETAQQVNDLDRKAFGELKETP
ncbi:MAG: hypothetical protein AM326_05010 [Candidatus Thorarchaeota archaeon SMTZ-45]|nr:MAG: hypothetical protein AM326_05010 [Candidatus Thorarchaeota archaeon SMTZ-45]